LTRRQARRDAHETREDNHVPTTEQVREAATRYASLVTSGDREAIVACFSVDAEVVDPYPAPAHVGHDAIRAFWDTVHGMGQPHTFEVEHIAVAGDSAAFLFRLAVLVGGTTLLGIRGFDVVRVDDDGLITALTAYWDPTSFAPVEPGDEE
jgi:steroid delta-isomerase